MTVRVRSMVSDWFRTSIGSPESAGSPSPLVEPVLELFDAVEFPPFAAARCKQANTQSQREDKADDFLPCS